MNLILSHPNNLKLSPHASLLYYWIQAHNRVHWDLSRDWTTFQMWTEEFLHPAMSRKDIYTALGQLVELDLITLEESRVTIKREVDLGQLQFPNSLRRFSWRSMVYNPFFWSGFMVTGVLLLWVNALLFSPSLAEPNMTSNHPYTVLREKSSQ
ncbi:hypothetical protein PN462_00070 [Spirulina sp. CS-785/01]|uniref:hypothetical protein n=1 Tax=Spirulina sp. CS-785/01 TaxID=3021716 RepID=UPI00232EBCE1|nr:hypothetical protein [Spirulina sp. CS-785/01]MDB9311476.1 hypothetical protein [Spirulina sp. CS-785/01]